MGKEWEGEGGEKEREKRGGKREREGRRGKGERGGGKRGREINNTYESFETVSLEYQDVSVSIICQQEILLHNHKQLCYIRQER